MTISTITTKIPLSKDYSVHSFITWSRHVQAIHDFGRDALGRLDASQLAAALTERSRLAFVVRTSSTSWVQVPLMGSASMKWSHSPAKTFETRFVSALFTTALAAGQTTAHPVLDRDLLNFVTKDASEYSKRAQIVPVTYHCEFGNPKVVPKSTDRCESRGRFYAT
jgi:hypothetical protein